jgi:anti-anti-sigma factor
MGLDFQVVEKKEEETVVALAGSLDSETYQRFEEHMIPIVAARPKKVTVDMKGVTYVSSMGIGAMIKVKKKIELSSGSLSLINLQPQVYKVFEIIKTFF